MDTSVDEVVFLRPLAIPLSQDMELGRVKDQSGEDWSPKAWFTWPRSAGTHNQNLINSQGHSART